MVPSNYPGVKRRCSKELSRWGCGFVDGGDVGCCFGNENTLRNDDYAVVLDRPLQVRTDVIKDITEHTDFSGEALDGILDAFAINFGWLLG